MTIDMNTLTANEQTAALILLKECLAGMGGKVPSDLAGDEYTWVDAATLVAHGWTKASAAGTFSALAAKGLISENESGEWALDAWRDVATLWDRWVEAGEVAKELGGDFVPPTDDAPTEADAFTAALIQAGADEEKAKGMGVPFPGIICSTLRHFAVRWTGTRAAFIKTAQLAGFNRFTAQTQWQRARKEVDLLSIIDALGE